MGQTEMKLIQTGICCSVPQVTQIWLYLAVQQVVSTRIASIPAHLLMLFSPFGNLEIFQHVLVQTRLLSQG
ncbi:hypothetical protein CUN61_09035 [Pseudomonas arsenicoxydans]|uniref:Uncharacterized protein n=1 Tax=Pseudomonas arsenicoxydans TaxID=702115 RepID=A0A4P6G405_9PSED|nr:hypothetical protein CUN61_09035 [Pseudomonas arsenicoxydans]